MYCLYCYVVLGPGLGLAYVLGSEFRLCVYLGLPYSK